MTRYEIWSLVVTAIGVAAGIVVLMIYIFQLKEMRKSTNAAKDAANAAVESNRAWIVPEQVILASPVENGLPLKYQIRISNSGRKPALGLNWKVRIFGVPYVPEGGQVSFSFGANGTCSGLDPVKDGGTVLYPSETKTWIPLSLDDTAENKILIDGVRRKTHSLVIEGCFTYLTDGRTHTSAFRFFLRDVPGPSFITDKQQNLAAAWMFNVALSGNTAD